MPGIVIQRAEYLLFEPFPIRISRANNTGIIDQDVYWFTVIFLCKRLNSSRVDYIELFNEYPPARNVRNFLKIVSLGWVPAACDYLGTIGSVLANKFEADASI